MFFMLVLDLVDQTVLFTVRVEEIVVVDDQGHKSDVWPVARLWFDATYANRRLCFDIGEPSAASELLRLVHTRFSNNLVV